MSEEPQSDAGAHAALAMLLRQNTEVVIGELKRMGGGSGSPLSALVAARTVAEVIEDVTRVLVAQGRRSGHTWAEIGQLLRTTRQAAQQRFAGAALEAASVEHAGLIRRATEIVEQLRDGEWEAVTGDWDATMRAKLSPDQLATVWEQVEINAGALQTVGRPSIVRQGPYRVADVPLAFEHGPMKARVTFNRDDTVGGLFILLPDVD